MSRKRRVLYILGSPVDLINWEDALEQVSTWSKLQVGRIICVCNVHMIVTAAKDCSLADVLAVADMVTPDGAPIAWTLRRSGDPKQERINGPDLMWRFLSIAEAQGTVVSFFGSSESTLSNLNSQIRSSFPNLSVGELISPPYGPISDQLDAEYVARINDARTGVLFVGLGCPKQELWMLAHKNHINSVMIGVGAAFDFHSGTVKRAPVWMRDHGLEWAHRLYSEPRRLWRRYLVTNFVFLYSMIRLGFKALHKD
jgi:N-acetylglucosaminyldiphosphoundecaprenol N-acetyl-beta-D-mannosaminyltransferase